MPIIDNSTTTPITAKMVPSEPAGLDCCCSWLEIFLLLVARGGATELVGRIVKVGIVNGSSVVLVGSILIDVELVTTIVELGRGSAV